MLKFRFTRRFLASRALDRRIPNRLGKPINAEIRSKSGTIVLIDPQGKHQGVKSLEEVLNSLDASQLTLVQLSQAPQPQHNNIVMPICRLYTQDQFQHLVEHQKDTLLNMSSATASESRPRKEKEIKIRENIGQHDLEVKLRKCHSELKKGHSVRVILLPERKSNLKFHLHEPKEHKRAQLAMLEDISKQLSAGSGEFGCGARVGHMREIKDREWHLLLLPTSNNS